MTDELTPIEVTTPEVETSPIEPPITQAPVTEPATTTQEPPVAQAPASSAARNVANLEVGMEFKGRVKSIELYGAFVDIGVGKDALLHISQLGKQNVRNVEDVVKAGEEITVYVLKVEAATGRIALSLEKPPSKPINDLEVGDVVTGKVVRIENFGAFLEIGAERPGMIHVSELATGYVQSPESVVKIGDEVQAKVIKVNRKKRQIDLSIKALEEERTRQDRAEMTMPEDEEDEAVPTAMELALRRAMGQGEGGSKRGSANDRRDRNSRKQRKELNDILSRTLDK
jgi:predicted RNA-binding protein with RPS1 domain